MIKNCKPLAFFFGFIVSMLLCSLFADVVLQSYSHLMDPGIDHFISKELSRYKSRNKERVSILLFGGSDVWSAIDYDVAKKALQERGIQFFLFAHSAGNAIVEAYQLLSALEIDENDYALVNVEPLDLSIAKEPAYNDDYETLLAYLRRSFMSKKCPELGAVIYKASADFFEFCRQRKTLRDFLRVYPVLSSSETPIEYPYGDEPEPEKGRNFKLKKYSSTKMDMGLIIDPSAINVQLLKWMKNKYEKHVIYWEIPRNPLYHLILSKSYFSLHEKAVQEIGLIRIVPSSMFSPDDFRDFNHYHSKGRIKVTESFLENIVHVLPNGESLN